MSDFSGIFLAIIDGFSSSPFGYYMIGILAILFAFMMFHRLSRNF